MKSYGIEVWFDEIELNVGDSLTQKIGTAIQEADYLCVVLSQNSINSQWVQKELQVAMQKELNEKRVVVLPLLLEDVSIPPFLQDKKYADFRTYENYEESFALILRSLGVPEENTPKLLVKKDVDPSRLFLVEHRMEERDEQMEAVATLRFELQSNFVWLNNIFESRNYLRDEAWVALKNKGFISYMVAPIPLKVISVYAKIHQLNEHIRVLRKDTQNFDVERAEKDRNNLITEITKLIELFDTKYPRIGENFREE